MVRTSGACRAARCGFTVLELLISITVIAILVALLAPAVIRSRAAAQRLRCSSNLHQIALATESYVDVWQKLPRATPLYRLLPFVEQPALHSQLAQSQLTADVHGDVPVYYCPLDAYVGPHPEKWTFLASYVLNFGWNFRANNGMSGTGLAVQPYLSWKHVTDGLSQTALFSEQLSQGIPSGSQDGGDWILQRGAAEPIRGIWWTAEQDWSHGEELAFAQHCLQPANRVSLYPPRPWLVRYDQINSEGYQHLTPPNSIGCQAVSGVYTAVAASSAHAGGVNTAFCDGSVRFVSSSIDADLWRAVGTRAGGEPGELP